MGSVMKDYEPYKDKFYKIRMLFKLKMSPTFRNVFKYDFTDKFDDYMKNIVDSDFQFTQNTILSLSGMTGTGKSMVAMTIGMKYFKGFTYKNMYFYEHDILDNAQSLPKNCLVVKDENPQKAIFGVGSIRTSQQFTVLSETARKHGLNIILVEPEFRPNGVSKFYLETVDMDINRRVTRVAMIEPTTLKYMGALYIKIIPESNKEWVLYNKMKDRFIKSIMESNYGMGKTDFNEISEKLTSAPELDICKNKTERKSIIYLKYPNLTTSEIKIISDLLEIKLRQKDGVEQ